MAEGVQIAKVGWYRMSVQRVVAELTSECVLSVCQNSGCKTLREVCRRTVKWNNVCVCGGGLVQSFEALRARTKVYEEIISPPDCNTETLPESCLWTQEYSVNSSLGLQPSLLTNTH